MTTPPLTFPARTPLPTEQERYLDMLLMVREAMIEASRWYYGMEQWQFSALAQTLGDLCKYTAASVYAGDAPPEPDDYIVDAVGQEWLGFTGAQDAVADYSETVAAFAN